ncbi:DUF7824 domain-containing protein [Streptomyces yaizuensis]|uniref:DUF6493 family protein n=1 Tax=Streptomyces yaizuensis TaxID=2989713 RepID=A0ABQ5NZA7_9ACTN|nr:DUF6493 family protein [Streptomyces sp. YSPA8]GLF95686.1 DUF6493 family protein [Streptomyces sp. YSPA8]
MSTVLHLVRSGSFREVPKALAPLTPAERKELLPELKALRAELRGWDWQEWQKRGRVATALMVAGAGCHPGAAAAATWIGARDLRISRGPGDPPVVPAVLEALAGRDTVWLSDLAHRLAARASTGEEDYVLIRKLVDTTRCPVPTSDGYVRGWAVHLTRHHALHRGLTLEPELSVLVTRLFELPELPPEVQWSAEPDNPRHWPQVLAGLADAGAVERPVVVDGCVSRLLRGGKPQDLKVFLAVLRALALTPQEQGARIPDWMGMAADGAGPVAAHAQGVLGALAESGALSAHELAETSGAVFFRTEKKLVRAQLTVLGKAVRVRAKAKNPDAVAVLLRAAGDAFGHADTGVQERALKLVARHLADVPDEVRRELADTAALLGPAHRETATAVFGDLLPEDTADAGGEILPAVPGRRRLPPPPDSVAELLSDLVTVVDGEPEPTAAERVVDGLVRLAYTEREELTEGLRETFGERWWFQPSHFHNRNLAGRLAQGSAGIELIIAAAAGAVPAEVLRKVANRTAGPGICVVEGICAAAAARLGEVAWRIRTETLPLLLATPTWDTGALDPETLVERLREYVRLGVKPSPVDFTQALLRVAAGTGGPAAKEAALLGTEEGDRLAAWLEGTGPELPALLNPVGAADGPAPGGLRGVTARAARALAGHARQLTDVQKELPPAFRWLGQVPRSGHRHGYRCSDGYIAPERLASWWIRTLPHHREAVAAWLRTSLGNPTGQYTDDAEWRAMTGALVRLAEGEADGVAGPELHRAVALGLGAAGSGPRLGAVDALLVLAAREQLDPALLGRLLGAMVQHDGLKPNRLADATRTAAATGAYTTTWAVLAAALPALLAMRPVPHSLGEVLGVAAECAERHRPGAPGAFPAGAGGRADDAGEAAVGVTGGVTGGTGTGAGTGLSDGGAGSGDGGAEGAGGLISGLAELVARGGTSARVTQAKRLLTAVRRHSDHSAPETARNSA